MTATMTRSEPLVSTGEPGSARGRWPAIAIIFGLLLAAAVAGAVHAIDSSHAARLPEATGSGFPTVGTSTNNYAPGHSSGWHVHPGVHSVVVLSGTLSVYDENCLRTEYAAGQTYLGGAAPHVARNEALDILDVAITFVYSPAAVDHGSAVPAPAGCDLR